MISPEFIWFTTQFVAVSTRQNAKWSIKIDYLEWITLQDLKSIQGLAY